jgi:hypothetical protein
LAPSRVANAYLEISYICVITNGLVDVSSLSVLDEMDLYWDGARKSLVNGKDVLAQLFEVNCSIP